MTVTKTGMITPGTAQYDNVNLTNINGSPYSGGGGGLSYTIITVTTDSLASSGDYYTEQLTGVTFDRFIVDYAIIDRLADSSQSVSVHLYDGDPDSGGVYLCSMYGGAFGTLFGMTFPTEGMRQVYGGATGLTCPVSGETTDLWVKVVNNDFSNSGTFEVNIWFREITGTP